jgi:ParB family chromosome partitioning protein
VSLDASGKLRVQRGYVRREDEPPVPVADEVGVEAGDAVRRGAIVPDGDEVSGLAVDDEVLAGEAAGEPEEDEGMQPISDKLLTELTAYRTLALRQAIGNEPGIAYLAALHVLCLSLFYRYALDSCLEINAKTVFFGSQAPGLGDTKLAADLDARHRGWAEQLPEDPSTLWDVLAGFDSDSRDALFAHCVSLTVNAVHEPYARRPKAHAHAAHLAETVSLDMVAAGWMPTVDNYLGRVTKARILETVREAKGDQAAQLIDHLKKGDMAKEAEHLLSGTGWLPEPLRTRGVRPPSNHVASAEFEETAQADESGDPSDLPGDHHDAADSQAMAAE